jgi:hypothetical protein
VLKASNGLMSRSFAPALSLIEAAVTTTVVAAGLPRDGVVGLDDLRVHDARRRLCRPALMLAQQLPTVPHESKNFLTTITSLVE